MDVLANRNNDEAARSIGLSVASVNFLDVETCLVRSDKRFSHVLNDFKVRPRSKKSIAWKVCLLDVVKPKTVSIHTSVVNSMKRLYLYSLRKETLFVLRYIYGINPPLIHK